MEISRPDEITGQAMDTGSAIYAERREQLRKKLIEKKLDLLVVSSPANRFYLSGFELHDPQPNESSGLLLLSASGEDWLLTDSRYALAAEKLWPKARIRIYKNQLNCLADCLINMANLAAIETWQLSCAYVRHLREFLGARVYLQKGDGLVEKLREIKDVNEIEALRQSFQLNHKMFHWLENRLAQGLTPDLGEEELSWEIERFFRENGAQELAFSTIAATGAKSAQPHALPDKDVIGKELPLLVDAGCRVRNYCSDQTRTWWLGQNPTKDFQKTMKLVRDAQNAALERMRAGVPCGEIYAVAREVFEKANVAHAFTHALGHGVGLETHEAPKLTPGNQKLLEAGMTVTVEPGLYYPEWGGIRWENTVLITEDGIEIL